MRKTFKMFCVAAISLLAVSSCGKIWDEFDAVHGELDDLTQRVEQLEKDLNADVKNLEDLIAAASAKIAVVAVEQTDGKVVLTLADGSKVELSKPLENVDNSGLVTIVEEDGVKYWAVNGQEGHTGVPVGHPEYSIEFQINADTKELQYSVNGGEWVGTGVQALAENAAIMTDFVEGEDYVEIIVNGTKIVLAKYSEDNSILGVARADFFLRYEGSKNVELLAEGMEEYYVMNEPDGWKAVIDGTTLKVTAPTKKAIEIGAAEAEGLILVHGTTAEGKCKVAKVEVKAGPGLTLAVDAKGNMTIENSYYGTSVNEEGETVGTFNQIAAGLATPEFFNEGTPADYVTDAYNGMSWDYMNTPNIYNFAEGGLYEEGKYETDIVNYTVADFYYTYNYSDLPLGSYFVVWVAPVDDEGNVIADEVAYVDYINHEWNAEVVSVTHSDAVLNLKVAGADSYAIGFAYPALWNYDPEYNPMTFDEYMLSPMGGPWASFTSYGAAEDMGMIISGDEIASMNGEIKLSELFGESLVFNADYYVWVMPMFDFKAKFDEVNSMPEWDDFVYDYSAYNYGTDFKPYVLTFKTNDIVAGGTHAATFDVTGKDFKNIYVTLTPSEGTESVYYYWYKAEEYEMFENDAEVMADLLEYCYSPATGVQAVNKTYANPGEDWVLATFSIGTDGKYGEIVTLEESTLPVPTTTDITIEEVSCELDAEGKNYTVTVKVAGASKVMGYNITHSEYNYGQFLVNVAVNGHKASYAGYQFVDVVDGEAVLTFAKNDYKKDYYVAAYNVENNVVSAISAAPLNIHLFD